jgi:HEAT repeat protein
MLDSWIADLQSPDPLVRVRAVPALADLGETAAKPMLTDDDSQHPLIRVLAAGAIARIDPGQSSFVLPVLVNALHSDDAPLQGAAADELGMIGKYAEPALPALLGLLEGDCAAVRSTAAEAIWRITGDQTPASQVGRALLRSEDWLTARSEGRCWRAIER